MRVVQPPPGPDADLDAVGAAIDQEARALGGGDVAGNDLDVGETPAELAHGPVHHHRMSMRDVDDEHVDAGAHELARALEVIAGRADRRADHQPSLRVAGRERAALLTHQVLGRDQPVEHALVIDERQLLDLALDHHALGFFRRGAAAMDDEPIERRHAIGDRGAGAVDEAEIALGEQAEQPPAGVDDDQRPDTRPRHQRPRLRHRHVRADAVGIGDDAVLRPLHLLDLADLRLDLPGPVAAVDDADASLFRLNHRHRRARDGVHVGRDDRPAQRDAPGQLARQVDDVGIAPRQHAVLRRQNEVVEGAATHELTYQLADPRVDGRESSHGPYYRGFAGRLPSG